MILGPLGERVSVLGGQHFCDGLYDVFADLGEYFLGIGGLHKGFDQNTHFWAFYCAVAGVLDANSLLYRGALVFNVVEECTGSGEIERHMFHNHSLPILAATREEFPGGRDGNSGGPELHCTEVTANTFPCAEKQRRASHKLAGG